MSEEIRNAIDAYLEGVSVDELRMLDAASKHAEESLKSMAATLKASNKRLDQLFAEVERTRRQVKR